MIETRKAQTKRWIEQKKEMQERNNELLTKELVIQDFLEKQLNQSNDEVTRLTMALDKGEDNLRELEDDLEYLDKGRKNQ